LSPAKAINKLMAMIVARVFIVLCFLNYSQSNRKISRIVALSS
jgi:hypothetical protein